ncbi:MAG: hypothetical protein QOJ98_2327 [Acidobacteriota bacterium]|jgi:O6-methylguanine-DNA--protein-cysteine methyltransferase|nr:hypothetical protein [Acidobacteriota bacterium]
MDMAKSVEKKRDSRSADIIRELRGPLPEDDPYMMLENGRYVRREPVEMSPEQTEAVRSVLHDVRALPKGTTLTIEEVAAYVHRLPGRPADWTSADVIREARGPLPDDDTFVHDRSR